MAGSPVPTEDSSDSDEVRTEISSFNASEADPDGIPEEVEEEERLTRPTVQCQVRRPSVGFSNEADALQAKQGRRLSVSVSASVLGQEGLTRQTWKEQSWEKGSQLLPTTHENDLQEIPETCMAEAATPKGQVVFFFDWDDTLLPTSAVCGGGWSGSPKPEALPALREHAGLVRDLLRAARALGHVGIVTLAQRPWVQFTSERYLIGVDWEQEFRSLGIPVVYAREALPKSIRARAMREEGVNFYVTSKTAAMARALKKLRVQGKGLNIISIGDSSVEMEAAKEVVWSQDVDADFQCKTLKLREEPSTVEELSSELREVMTWIKSLTLLPEDLDLELDEANAPNSPLRRAQGLAPQLFSN